MMGSLWQRLIHFLAYGLGTGLSPFAPGTVGSLVGVALVWVMAPLAAPVYAAVTGVLFVAGIYICGRTAQDLGAKDPGSIVFDEIVGFLVAMYMIPATWPWLLAGFIIYRVFDIWKPWPVGAVENQFDVGTAIMLDDVVAGLYTLAILQLARLILERTAA